MRIKVFKQVVFVVIFSLFSITSIAQITKQQAISIVMDSVVVINPIVSMYTWNRDYKPGHIMY
jgi:succinate-acetate transporter protein